MYNFDELIPREGFDCIKWSYLDEFCPDTGTVPGIPANSPRVLPMWVADMDLASPPEVVEAVQTRAAHPVYGYAGKPDAYYESFIHWMQIRHQALVERDWIVFSPGIVPAIATAIRAFTGPGDGVAIMPPVYHPFRQMVEKNRRTVREAPLRIVDGRYEIDFDALDAAAASSRLLVLCSPHNPVGRVWTRDELLGIAEIAERHDLVVLADEIHADLVFHPNRHIPSLLLPETLGKRLISAWAPSKTFNIAGLQVSYIVVPDQGLRKAFADETEATGIGTPNCLGVAAAEAAYRHGGPWLDALLPYLSANYTHLKDSLAQKVPGLRVYPCEGSYLAWIDFRGVGLQGNVHKALLDRAGLWLDAGSRFGSGGDGFARLNFGCPRSMIDEAITRLAQAFQRLTDDTGKADG
ncbi:MAG: MalY/PatB family protein [Spirochaetota bacterium]